jgi:hypothetical protein
MKWPLILLAAQVFAQNPAPPGLSLPKPQLIKLKPLNEKERAAVNSSGRSPMTAGVHRTLPAKPTQGKWTKLNDGTSLWRLAIHSPNAKAMRIHFTSFDAGQGRVWVYASGGRQFFGPYSGKGPGDHGDFWADLVDGNTVVVEFQPRGKALKPPFEIPEISHLAR